RAMATAQDPVTVARIDFTGVGCIDYSCADEIVAKLLRDRRAVVVLSGISDGHREAIEPVLAGHGLAALIERPDGGGELEALGAPEAAAALLHDLVARRLAVRTSAGIIALTLARSGEAGEAPPRLLDPRGARRSGGPSGLDARRHPPVAERDLHQSHRLDPGSRLHPVRQQSQPRRDRQAAGAARRRRGRDLRGQRHWL